MRKILGALVCAVLVLCSCDDDNSTLGSSLVETSFRNVFVDSCSVVMSSILVDSVETVTDTICQVGYMNDSIFGIVKSTFCTEFSVNKFTPDIVNYEYRYDSITLRLFPSGHYWGDTLATQTVDIYKLKNQIILTSNESLYNITKMTTEDSLLCSIQYKPHPLWTNWETEIRLPDDFGEEIFNDIMAESRSFDSQEQFASYLHGFAFVPRDDGTCMTGFLVNDSSMALRMYYRRISGSTADMELDFVSYASHSYTGVEHTREGYVVENLSGGGAVWATASNQTEDMAFLQGLTGIYTMIEFPYLNDLMRNGDIVSVESATLYLYPKFGTYGPTSNPLPETLRLYIADDDNNTVDQIYNSMGTTVQDGSLYESYTSVYDAYYSFDLTSFIQDNFGTWGQSRQKLYLILDDNDFTTTFYHVVFNNGDYSEVGQTRLDIRFKVYDE